jgi:CheY-like chemotaxis protein
MGKDIKISQKMYKTNFTLTGCQKIEFDIEGGDFEMKHDLDFDGNRFTGNSCFDINSLQSILIIDDSIPFHKFIVECLEKDNYNVVTTINGEGVNKAVEINPFVILLDFKIPNKDSKATLEALRKVGITSPVIALSQDETEELKNMGVIKFITKPLDCDELLIFIRDM